MTRANRTAARFGPTRAASSLRRLKRRRKPHAQIWLRNQDETGQVQDYILYTTVGKQTLTAEAGVLLSFDLMLPTSACSALSHDIRTRKGVRLARDGAQRLVLHTGTYYSFDFDAGDSAQRDTHLMSDIPDIPEQATQLGASPLP